MSAREPIAFAPRSPSSFRGFSEAHTLRGNALWSIAGIGSYAVAQWGVVVLLAKLGTPTMVGQVALGLAIGAPVFLFANLRLRAVLATDAAEKHRLSDYLAVRLATSAIGMLAVAAIALLEGGDRQTRSVILWIGIAKLMESGSDLSYGLWQRAERMKRIAISQMARGVLSVVLVAGLLAATGSAGWASAGLAVGWALVLLVHDLPQSAELLGGFRAAADRLKPIWNAGGFRRLLWLTLPLGLASMLASLNINIPRYFIEHELGQSELGKFGALSYIGIASNLLVNGIVDSGAAKLGRDRASGQNRAFGVSLLKLFAPVLVISVAGILAAFCFGSQILTVLYTPAYAARTSLLVLLMVTAAVTNIASILSQALIAVGRFKTNLIALVLAVVVTASACVWLVPIYGLDGAAVATALGMAAMAILAGVKVWRGIRS